MDHLFYSIIKTCDHEKWSDSNYRLHFDNLVEQFKWTCWLYVFYHGKNRNNFIHKNKAINNLQCIKQANKPIQFKSKWVCCTFSFKKHYYESKFIKSAVEHIHYKRRSALILSLQKNTALVFALKTEQTPSLTLVTDNRIL